MEFNINGKLVGDMSPERQFNNEKKTKYHVAQFRVIVKGEPRLVSAIIYAKNKGSFTVGETYTLNGRIEGSNIYLSAAPFASSERLTLEDIAGLAKTPATKGAEV